MSDYVQIIGVSGCGTAAIEIWEFYNALIEIIYWI